MGIGCRSHDWIYCVLTWHLNDFVLLISLPCNLFFFMHTLSHCITTETQHPHCSHNLFKQAALQIIGLLSCDSYWSINSHFDSSNGVLTNMSSSWYHWYWLHLVTVTFHHWKVHWALNAEGLLSCVVDICNKLRCTQPGCPYELLFFFYTDRMTAVCMF